MVIAPLTAPIAVFAGVWVHAVVGRAVFHTASRASLGSTLFLLWLLMLFGIPISYAGTLIVLWPVTLWLQGLRFVRWWTLSAAGAVAGAALLPFAKAVLLPGGAIELFPGDGATAGAVVGFTMWLLAFRGTSESP